jgi:hypothetical protein
MRETIQGKKEILMKLVRFAFVASVMTSAVACMPSSEPWNQGQVAEDSFALGVATRVVGDTTCPSGYSLATPAEATANQQAICNMLDTWDIARLAGGGSMDGPGYGCAIRPVDTRSLGHAVCKQPTQFARGIDDGVCPSGYTVADSMVARANQSAICSMLDTWDIARLADGGSMDGPGYGCEIRDADERELGHTVCVQLDFVRPTGDQPCPAGSALISPQEARARTSELCDQLEDWDIARLDGGGSMDGPGYGCTIRDSDTRELGHALCGAL